MKPQLALRDILADPFNHGRPHESSKSSLAFSSKTEKEKKKTFSLHIPFKLLICRNENMEAGCFKGCAHGRGLGLQMVRSHGGWLPEALKSVKPRVTGGLPHYHPSFFGEAWVVKLSRGGIKAVQEKRQRGKMCF